MRHHDRDPHDALNDYLDSLAGATPADSRAGALDPDLRDGVDRFFALAERAGATPRATNRTERPTMATNLTLPTSSALAPPVRTTSRHLAPPSWTRHLHLASTALLIVTVIALAFAAFGPNGIGRNGSNGEPDGNLAAVPLATVEPDRESSSIPFPTAAECTAEPMTRDELIAHLEAANTATAPKFERYERAIEPTPEEAEAIMATYRQWQACGQGGNNYPSLLRLQTPWYSANQLGVFYNYGEGRIDRPVSEAELQEYADVLLHGEDAAAVAQVSPMASPPPASPPAIPGPDDALLPLPAGATPIAIDTDDGGAVPTIFADDIVMWGPDAAFASAYFVNPKTGEVNPGSVLRFTFVKVDGQWLINTYQEGLPG